MSKNCIYVCVSTTCVFTRGGGVSNCSYAKHFSLIEHVLLGCEVVAAALDRQDSDSWTVSFRNIDDGVEHTLKSRFLVVCSGFFATSVIPNIPRNDFAGAIRYLFGGRLLLPNVWKLSVRKSCGVCITEQAESYIVKSTRRQVAMRTNECSWLAIVSAGRIFVRR